MARTAEQQTLYNKEKYIGRKAAKLAQDFVLARIRSTLNIHNKGDEDFKPILQATKVQSKMGSYRLLGLNLTSNKAGFILHYGFTGVRSGSIVLLEAARYHKSATKRESHFVHLQAEQLFENIYQKSGALDYLASALSETRTKAVELAVQNLVVKLNAEEDGK